MTAILQRVIATVYGAIPTWRAAAVWPSGNCVYRAFCVYSQYIKNNSTIYLIYFMNIDGQRARIVNSYKEIFSYTVQYQIYFVSVGYML
jgi:hypothetical protein